MKTATWKYERSNAAARTTSAVALASLLAMGGLAQPAIAAVSQSLIVTSATAPSSATVQPSLPRGRQARTTESLRGEIFGDDEDAADAWTQLNAFVRYSQWSDAAEAAQSLVTHQPTVLLRRTPQDTLYWPARRAIGDLLSKHNELRDTYRTRHDLEAQALLADFDRTERLESLERLLTRFPFTSLRGQALRMLADGYLGRADFARAADAFAQLQATERSSTNTAAAAAWACKEATSLLGAGLVESAAAKIAAIRRAYGSLALDAAGDRLKVADLCDSLEKEIAGLHRAGPTPFSPDRLRSATGWTFGFDAPPLEAAFRRDHPNRMPLYEPAARDGVAYATDGNQLRAVGIATGFEQWKRSPDRPERYNIEGTQRWLEQLSPTSLRPAVTERHVLFLRPVELAETVHSLCCLDRATGRLLWQRVAWSDERESVETAPAALGDRGFAIVSSLQRLMPDRLVVKQRAVVCFRLDNAELLWRTVLPSPGPPTADDIPGSVAGPFVSTTCVLVLEDRGALYCLNHATGEMEWARTIEGRGPEPTARPGSGVCVAANDRVCVARTGSPQVECFDLESGRRLWTQGIGAPVRWLAADGESVFAAGKEMRALALANGAPRWHGEPAEPPIAPGCLRGDLVWVPTAQALHVYEARSGRLADRLTWPDKSPMTHLVAGDGAIVGLSDDAICKFGKPGLAPVIAAVPPTKPALPPKASGQPPSPDEVAAAQWFPNVQLSPGRSIEQSFSVIGRPLVEWVTDWIVYDASARQLRRVAAGRVPVVRWQVAFSGNVRRIEFDDGFVYLFCDDRIEIRRANDGGELYRKPAEAIRQPVFGQGRATWAYERVEGGAKKTRLAAIITRSRKEYDLAIGDLGLQSLCAYAWEGERFSVLGAKPGGERVFATARIRSDGALADLRTAPADEIVRSVDFNRNPWVSLENRLVFVGPDNRALYCYNFMDGKRLWECSLDPENKNRLPLAFAGRVGRHLLWSQVPNAANAERTFGVVDLQGGQKLGTVEGHHAFLYRNRLYSLNGRVLRAHEIGDGRVLKAIQYPRRPDEPVWAQPFGGRLVVAIAYKEGPIRQVLLQDSELSEDVTRVRGDQAGRQTEIPAHHDPIRIDGSVGDWEGVRMGWQEITTWRPVLDPWGRAAAGGHSPSDCSARWRACVKEDALYLVVAVRDDRIVCARSSDCPWIGDSLEVGLRGERFARNMPTFTLSLDGPEQCWAAGPQLPSDQVCVRYDPLDRELVYEMAIPWSWLTKGGILVGKGERGRAELGFDLVVNDNDGAGLKGSLEWGDGLVESWNPSEWKSLRFEFGR